jgi:hypothetical protein
VTVEVELGPPVRPLPVTVTVEVELGPPVRPLPVAVEVELVSWSACGIHMFRSTSMFIWTSSERSKPNLS